ncbi:MAG: hypothetical protein PF569_03755 [Candidatus Woesearchaeota archaeon]|jgi:hypothetical protein|nr:hypothetical protein [Candidatus Woesearchaeota archaeon]
MKKFFKSIKEALLGWFPKEVSTEEVFVVKELLKNSFKVMKTYQESNEDEEISFLEWIAIVKTARPLLNDIRNWKAIKERLLNFNYNEGRELANFIVQEGVLPEKAEFVVEHLLAYIEIQVSAYKEHGVAIIDTFRK